MKKTIFILAILIFSLLYYMGVLTHRETLPFSKEFFTIGTPFSADRAWDLKTRDPVSKKELDQLYELKLDKGIQNIPLLSFSDQGSRTG